MKFQQYLNNESYNCIIDLISFGELSEMNTKTFNTIKKIGNKLGLRVNKSLTIWDFFKKINKNFFELYRLAAVYLVTDITDSKSRNIIVTDAKKIIKGLNKKEMMSFMFQLDKASFGITAHIRHVIQSIFGVEITTYNNWVNNKDYLNGEVNRMIKVLNKMGSYPDELKHLISFQKSLKELEI